MKNKLYSKIHKAVRSITVFDIIFLTAAVLLFFFAVLMPPARSVADQGDYERVMQVCGLTFPDKADYSFYEYAERFYRDVFAETFTDITGVGGYTILNLLLYIPRLLMIIPTTTFIYPTLAARLLCLPFGAFDVRFLAVVMFVWYAVVCFLLLRSVRLKNVYIRLAFTAAFLFVFCNGVNLTLFNSMYGQSVMLASFMTLSLAAVSLFSDIRNAKRKTLVFFAISSCLLLGSKLQCVVYTPFLAAMLVWAARKCKFKKTALLCAGFVLYYGIVGYMINGIQLNTDTQYNSVFYGILKDSANPRDDLRFLGIDEDMAVDAGKHAYLDSSEYKYPPRTPVTYKKFHSKMNNGLLVKFYVSHPLRLIGAMEKTANNAFHNSIELGTFEKDVADKYGIDAGSSSYRLKMWESVRQSLPKTLWFIIPFWVVAAAAAIFGIKKKNRYSILILVMLIAGGLQFPMPYMGNGAADISKQLFLFNITFDAVVTIAFYILLQYLDKKIEK